MKNGRMRRKTKRVELGQYVVADPEICHGQPTFKGTRIMVWQVLDDVADGRSWEFICNKRWGGRIPLAAVAEAVRSGLFDAFCDIHASNLKRNAWD